MVANWLASFVYYLTHLTELQESLDQKYNPFLTHQAEERAWKAMNMPLFLHGEVLGNNRYASMINILSTDETFVAELPTRIARLSTDVTSRWKAQERKEHTNHHNCTPHRYLQSLLSGESTMSLTPAPVTEKQENAPMGEILQEVSHGGDASVSRGSVVVQFREKFSFCDTLNGAVRRVIQSYKRQTGEGSLCFISLLDEQQLASVAEQSQMSPEHDDTSALAVLSRQPSTFVHSRLLNYSGQVHVHDLALMLEEILYFYRPDGVALSSEVLRDVLSRYDEWVDTVAEPMDLEVLTAANTVLQPPSPEKSTRRSVRSSISHHISHHISHSVSHSMNHSLRHSLSRSKSHDEEGPVILRAEDVLYRGHFQQQEMVASAMHFDQLALELKEHSPAATPTTTTSSETAGNTVFNSNTPEAERCSPFAKDSSTKIESPDRYSCKWSDIRLVLEAETQRLQEAEKSILGAALRGLSGRQKLSMAERMSARRFASSEPTTKLHIAHATVSCQRFVVFLHEVLAAEEE